MTTTTLQPAAPTYREAIAVRSFRLLLASHGLATAAQLMLTLALGIAVHERTGSAVGASASVAIGLAPYVVCSGAAGTLADLVSRSSALAGSAALRAMLAVALVVALAADAPTVLLVSVVAATAVIATVGYPALAAATAQSVPDRELPAANTLVTGVENSLWIAGPGIVGALGLLGLGPEAVITAAAGVLVVATMCASAAPLPRPAPVDHPATLNPFTGLTLVMRRGDVRRPMAIAIVSNFLYGYLVVHLVLVSGGVLNVAFAAGAFAALVFTNQLTGSMSAWPLLALVMAAFSGAAALLGVAGAGVDGALAIALAGSASLVSEVIAVTLIQRAAPEEVMGRVFGVYDQLNVGAIAVGSLLVGPLATLLGAGTALVVVAACCVGGVAAAVLPPLVSEHA